MAKRGRPPRNTPPRRVVVQGSPKLRRYLEVLVAEEGYGNSVPEVATTLIWRGIEDLINKGIIDRIVGAYIEDSDGSSVDG